MKKKLAVIASLLLTVTLFSSCNGYLYIGDGWQDTPEKALTVAADDPLDGDVLTAVTVLDTWYIGDKAFMLFVSKDDNLVEALFVTNGRGKYHFQSRTCGSPDSFVLYQDEEHSPLDMCTRYETVLYGYKYSSEKITVNGAAPEEKTLTFTCQGKEWFIDRWWVEVPEENSEIKLYRESE